MESFSKEKAKDSNWQNPAMYTHVSGYKFCIGVNANGHWGGRGKSICVNILVIPGEFDDQLKWPAKANFTIELVNQQGGENATCTTLVNIERPTSSSNFLDYFKRITIGGYPAFLEHSLLHKFLINDTARNKRSKIVEEYSCKILKDSCKNYLSKILQECSCKILARILQDM